MADHRSIDELYAAYLRELPSGTENHAEPITVGFQYQVAKAQARAARVSAWIAVAAVGVAIASVLVAALR